MKRFGMLGWDASLKRLDKCCLKNKRGGKASTPFYFYAIKLNIE